MFIISVSLILVFIPSILHPQNIPNSDDTAPEIETVKATDPILIYEEIEIKANVTDDSGIKEVFLCYESFDGIEKSIPMYRENGSIYAGRIPPQNFTGKLIYYIYAEDTEKNINRTKTYEMEIHPRLILSEAADMLYHEVIQPLRGDKETAIYVYSEFPKNETSLPGAKILEKNERISDSTGVLYTADSPVWFFYVPNLFTSNSSNTSEACIFISQHEEIIVRPCVGPVRINNITVFETIFNGSIPVTIFPIPQPVTYDAKESLENATASAIDYMRAQYGNNTEKALIVCKYPVLYNTDNESEAHWTLYMPMVGSGFSQGLIYQIDCDTGKTNYSYGIISLDLPYGSEYRTYIDISLKNPSWNDSVFIFYSIPGLESR